MEYLPLDRNRRQQSWADGSGFTDPVYLDDEDIRAFQKRAAERRRRLTRSRRRQVNKARKRRRFELERGVVRANWGEERFAPFVVTRRRPSS
jgi:RNA:NAD 2'-phosphotransferase (TPT1/KptA family)